MTVTAPPSIRHGCLMVRGKVVFTEAPDNVVFTPTSDKSAFTGARAPNSSSYHLFTLGVRRGNRLMHLFRLKIWWMMPAYGNSGRDTHRQKLNFFSWKQEKRLMLISKSPSQRLKTEKNLVFWRSRVFMQLKEDLEIARNNDQKMNTFKDFPDF